MSTRLSAEELDFIKRTAVANGDVYVARLTSEIEASWNERDAARRALRDLMDAIDSAQPPLGSVIAAGWTRFEDALIAARAVLSENREAE